MSKASSSSSTKSKKRATGKKKRDAAGILSYREKYVVVDTKSNFLYIGKLGDMDDRFLVLKDADVHDCRESPSMNEKYIIDAKRYGVRVNRALVHIRLAEVVSVSLLDHVIEY